MKPVSEAEARLLAEQQQSDLEMVRKRILKLRWIGLERDALRLYHSLRPADQERISLFSPRDTD